VITTDYLAEIRLRHRNYRTYATVHMDFEGLREEIEALRRATFSSALGSGRSRER